MKKLFEKIAALFLVFMLMMGFSQLIPNITAEASASASGECGTSGVKWELEDNVLTISGEGKIPMYYYANPSNKQYAPWYDFSDSIKKVVIKDGITGIGGSAFAYCSNIKTVEIAESVYSIGASAFAQCENLESVEMSKNIDYIGALAFSYCSSLESIEIPENVDKIYLHTFLECKSLKKVTLPKNLELIESGAFEGCDMMTAYVYKDSNAEKLVKKEFIGYKYIDSEDKNVHGRLTVMDVYSIIIYAVAGVLIAGIVAVIIILVVKRNKES